MHKIFTVRVFGTQALDEAVNRFLSENEHIQVISSNQSIIPGGGTVEIIYSIIYKEGRQPTRIGYLGKPGE
ncbi:hypothetical protein F0L74_15120 [Chitinophaga agrisoli]|uniref:Uncharacterized protein n=1 Tax=Chitinophaga agrisoli TaxID=2607653 RepID=A0A5B2VYA5_9BACT|nr:hypothetical protein [Chitinophaga agrisoli]KAA2243804.1 hypothetical protein F0L74_15120 [Chitinophaga agrisoli]